MKGLYTILFIMFMLSIFAFPINDYDYRSTIKNVSPVICGMGGLNVSSTNDPFSFYGNPALLAENESSSVSISYQIEHEQDSDFYDNISASTLLKKNQFLGVSIVQQTGAVLMLPLSNIDDNKTYEIDDVTYNENLDYALTAYQISFGALEENWGIGIGIKYLNGEIVYLKKHKSEEDWILDEFESDNANGFSTDLGLTRAFSNLRVGLSLYDVWSKLYWKDNPNRNLKRRFAFGSSLESESSYFIIGISGKLEKDMDQTYHCGYSYKMSLSDPMIINQSIDLRIGAYSDNFSNQEDIFTTFGLGYYFKSFKIDVSVTNNDMLIKNSVYKMSVSVGI